MSTYIRWPKSIDDAFRAAYLEQTGEAIQAFPPEDKTHYEVGSNRLTAKHIMALTVLYPEITIYTQPGIIFDNIDPGGISRS